MYVIFMNYWINIKIHSITNETNLLRDTDESAPSPPAVFAFCSPNCWQRIDFSSRNLRIGISTWLSHAKLKIYLADSSVNRRQWYDGRFRSDSRSINPMLIYVIQ